MKIKKTVTSKVVDVNRHNGAQTHGPANCEATKMNAWKHGLTAKCQFLNEEEQKELADLITDLEAEYAPETASEKMAVQDLAILRFKLERAQSLQLQQWKLRRQSVGIAFEMLAGECGSDELSELTRSEDLRRGAQAGWECTELEITSGSSSIRGEGSGGSSNSKCHEPKSLISGSRHSEHAESGVHVLVRAKINTGVETLLRYEKSLRKDSYYVMNVLQRLKGRKGITDFSSGGNDPTE